MADTRVGKAVLNNGAFGEVGPIVAMAVLLGARGAFASLVLLTLFAAVAVAAAMLPARLLREGTRLLDLVRGGADSTGQTTMRLTMLRSPCWSCHCSRPWCPADRNPPGQRSTQTSPATPDVIWIRTTRSSVSPASGPDLFTVAAHTEPSAANTAEP